MANYTIAYSCGHTTDKQLYGKHESRRSYIEWAAKSGQCPDCAKVDAANALDVLEAEQGLPVLTGSDKQIAWARKIRAEKIADILATYAKFRAKAPANKLEAFELQCQAGMQLVIAQVAASWWIDNRSNSGVELIGRLYREAQ